MAQTDARTVMSHLKKGELSCLYYFYGQNVSGVESITRAVIKKACGDNEEFALTRFSGKELNISELRDTMEMIPMMSPYNCILVNDYNFEEHREDDNKKLLETLKNIPSATVVIFNVTGFEVRTKKVRGRMEITDKNKKLADLASKNGVCCEQGIKTPRELAREIAASVSARGGYISLPDAQEVAERCVSDTLAISNEIDKLCAYADGREITREMVDLLVHRQSDVTIYDLADAVGAFNRKTAFELLDELWQSVPNSEKRSLVSSITSSFLNLYRAACAQGRGKNFQTVASDFGYRSDYPVKLAFGRCSGMSIQRLRQCIKILRDTSMELNSTSSDERVLLETAVTKMLMTGMQINF